MNVGVIKKGPRSYQSVYEIFGFQTHSASLYQNRVDIFVGCDDVSPERALYANIYVILLMDRVFFVSGNMVFIFGAQM